jgi:transposase
MVDFGDNWDNVIFSDEKKFNLDGPDGMQYYWHDIRKENETCFSRQQGGGSIMVWGAFSAKGTSQLAILDGRQTAEMYVDTLSEYMLPFAHQNYGLDYIFQQDNASIHTASVTREFFCDMNIEVMSWPALSPDLNPIENLWGLLVRKVYACGRQFLTKNDLKSQISKSWSEIGQSEIKPLIKPMKMRCIGVFKSKRP